MFKIKKNKKGFTVIELLIVVTIMALLIAVVLPGFSSFRKSQILSNSSEEILSSLSRARSETLASVSSSEYGVHFDSDQVVIFKGTIYTTPNSSNEIIKIVSPATISNNLSGGGNDVYFSKLYGVPNKTGTILVSIPGYSTTKIITILASG